MTSRNSDKSASRFGKCEPLHVAQIGGRPLRFFAPLGPFADFPWPALYELVELCGLDPDEVQREVEQGALDVVLTASGSTVIGHDLLAQELLKFAIETGRADADLIDAYEAGRLEAFKRLTRLMPPVEQFRAYLAADRGAGFGGCQ